jgi:glyceraldehyde-3-phosphate dehydrogenase (NADP+)
MNSPFDTAVLEPAQVAGGTDAVINPYNGEVVGHYTPASREEVHAALEAASEAFGRVRWIPASERLELLCRIAELISERTEALAALIRAEAGKPVLLARMEVERAAQTFRFAAQEASASHDRILELDASPAGENHTGLARRVPIGVILGISPFNFPLNLIAHKVAPCIASGNAILLKPSPRTPLTALALADILAAAGMPKGQVRILPFDHKLIPELLEKPAVKMLTFTGSAAVGWDLKRLAARQRVTLELGGNAAVIVHIDGDWETAARMIAAGAFNYAGQSCISVQRVLVQSRIYDRFREAFVRCAAEMKTGDPADEATVNGPMIDAAARDRILAWTHEAQEMGGRLALPLRHEGNCVWPIILEEVASKARIVSEEAFGPVAVLSRYEEFEHALEKVNASRFGLQAGLFTSSFDRAEQAFHAIEAGTVLINQVPTFRVENMPYGGVKESGFGREGVRYAMEEMTEWKAFVVRVPHIQ